MTYRFSHQSVHTNMPFIPPVANGSFDTTR